MVEGNLSSLLKTPLMRFNGIENLLLSNYGSIDQLFAYLTALTEVVSCVN